MWKHYLKLAKVKEEDLTPTQRTEMRKAFYGGVGELFISYNHIGSKLSVEEFRTFNDTLARDLSRFWIEQMLDIIIKKN